MTNLSLVYRVDRVVIVTTQCGNFRIFLSFKFYVKPILEDLGVLKTPFLPFQGLQILLIWQIFQPTKSAKIHKSQNSDALNESKWQMLPFYNPQN